MKTHLYITLQPEENASLCVTDYAGMHGNIVSLHSADFCLKLTPAHIQAVSRLLDALVVKRDAAIDAEVA
jgi:hypothetical protein